MKFLKSLFWVVVTAIVMIFSTRNWEKVSVKLWGALVVDVKLPLLLFFAFVVGFIPGYLMFKAGRWQARRRLDSANRALDGLRDQFATPEAEPDDHPFSFPAAGPAPASQDRTP